MDIKITISGAAEGHCSQTAKEKAFEVGKAVAKHGAILLTGATTGVPSHGARGAKSVGGVVIGFSPASSHKEHVNKYHLPDNYHDIVFYSSFGYSGRNALLTNLSDAVITVCGRIGTLNEFTTTFEEHKIIGVLLGSGGISDEIPHIIEVAERGPGRVIYDHDPDKLVVKVIEAIKKDFGNE